ncbi:hypothetical protein BDV97DRAFT_150347 [Delphinella strobiligena]|nr:hypothetical protein BDV97DRAFT_150347 [Delphinella strobiligena]
MSVTVTENRATYSFARTLADYDIHHTAGAEYEPQELNERPDPRGTGHNPPDWPDDYRHVPPYRPIDHEIDHAYRNTYTNGIEHTFIWNMMRGIQIAANRMWRATGGKINDTYFRFPLGGEY